MALQPCFWMACATACAIADAVLPPCQKALAMASAVAFAALPPSADRVQRTSSGLFP